MADAYPADREADVVLRDGSTVHLRPVRETDRDDLRDLLDRLGPRSLAFRFFSAAPDLDSAARLMAETDYSGRYGLVATRGGERRVVGHGMYMRGRGERAEVAFAVADEMQGEGLGTILLAHLAQAAAGKGIAVFVAEVLPQNHRMIEVFRESGFPVETSSLSGAIHIELPTSFTPEAVERFQERDRLAACAAVRNFLEPRAVAVLGASRRRGSVGGEVFHNLLDSGFEGAVYPVNPSAEVVQSVRAYRSVADVPGDVDLAVVAVPADAVARAARECGERGVPALVVLSAGFAEVGPEGATRERELVEACRESGTRLVGPNCLGVLATGPTGGMNATFAPGSPPPGNVGFVTQSGALGLALIELAADRGIGVSSFASIGNRADITANDLLEYWEGDPRTAVPLLYIESFSDPRRFARLARRIGPKKPIVVVKSGRSVAGRRATESHTGAMLSSSEVTVDALFDQAGVIRTETLSELLDVASLLGSQPLPTGPRVGIVTNAGGPGIMCADACEAAGLEVPELPEEVRARLREFLAPEASLGNPVDMIATAGPEKFRRAIATLAGYEGIDALIVIFIRPLLVRAEDVADGVRAGVAEMPRRVPVQAVFMSGRDRETMASAGGVPTHLYPEDAARSLGRVMRHVRWRARPRLEPPSFEDRRADEASAVIAEALAEGGGWLGQEAVSRLLDCHGVPTPAWRAAASPEEAGRAAAELGGPVAIKAHGPEIVHKTELGAVRVGLAGAEEVQRAVREIDESLAAAGVHRDGLLVQAMAAEGPELLVGVVSDPTFGPVIACGAGGTQAELLGDVSVRICPIDEGEAEEMVASLRTYPLLSGFRGAPPSDLGALRELLLRVSSMVDEHREIFELDLNPVVAGQAGACAVDARVRLAPAPAPRPWPSTWR